MKYSQLIPLSLLLDRTVSITATALSRCELPLLLLFIFGCHPPTTDLFQSQYSLVKNTIRNSINKTIASCFSRRIFYDLGALVISISASHSSNHV
jgi:hypothetical protein